MGKVCDWMYWTPNHQCSNTNKLSPASQLCSKVIEKLLKSARCNFIAAGIVSDVWLWLSITYVHFSRPWTPGPKHIIIACAIFPYVWYLPVCPQHLHYCTTPNNILCIWWPHSPSSILTSCLTHLPLDKMGGILADDIFKRIFLNENVRISYQISLKLFPRILLTISQHWFR